MARYDVAVIGSGNGGLAAAAALAQKGRQVLLLERHNIPGGCATSFRRGRFEFEVALHQLSGMGSEQNPGPLRRLLSGLGVTGRLDFVEMDDLFRVILPNRMDIVLKPDRNQILDELTSRFPKEKAGLENYFQLVWDYVSQLMGATVFRDPEVTPEKYPLLHSHAFKTAQEVMDEHFNDPLLKAALGSYWGYIGLPPGYLPFTYHALLFFTYVEFKPYHIKGGSQALSNALLSAFLEYGGEVRFNCAAKRILVREGRVQGIETADGEKIETRYVVSNASKINTFTSLMEPGQAPPAVLEEMRGHELSPSALIVYAGLDCEPETVGINEATNFILMDEDVMERPYHQMQRLWIDSDLRVLSCYDAADPDFSPPGTCQFALATLKFGRPWLTVAPDDYHDFKYRAAEQLLRGIEPVFPGVRDYMEEVEVATPVTFMRYLGHPLGAVFGFGQLQKDALFFQPDRKTSIEGLYLAGGWAGDCGFETTLRSGASAAKAIMKQQDGA